MNKIYKVIILFLFLGTALSSCLLTDSSSGKQTKGTVKYIELEGGFYGIITDENESLDPINLGAVFQSDGKRIEFTYKVRSDLVSFHMWGKIVELQSVKEINN